MSFNNALKELIIKWRNDYYHKEYKENAAFAFADDVDTLHNSYYGWFNK